MDFFYFFELGLQSALVSSKLYYWLNKEALLSLWNFIPTFSRIMNFVIAMKSFTLLWISRGVFIKNFFSGISIFFSSSFCEFLGLTLPQTFSKTPAKLRVNRRTKVTLKWFREILVWVILIYFFRIWSTYSVDLQILFH